MAIVIPGSMLLVCLSLLSPLSMAQKLSDHTDVPTTEHHSHTISVINIPKGFTIVRVKDEDTGELLSLAVNNVDFARFLGEARILDTNTTPSDSFALFVRQHQEQPVVLNLARLWNFYEKHYAKTGRLFQRGYIVVDPAIRLADLGVNDEAAFLRKYFTRDINTGCHVLERWPASVSPDRKAALVALIIGMGYHVIESDIAPTLIACRVEGE